MPHAHACPCPCPCPVPLQNPGINPFAQPPPPVQQPLVQPHDPFLDDHDDLNTTFDVYNEDDLAPAIPVSTPASLSMPGTAPLPSLPQPAQPAPSSHVPFISA